MVIRPVRRRLAVWNVGWWLAGVAGALALIVWAEGSMWRAVQQVRQRAEAAESRAFHLSDHLEALVRKVEETARERAAQGREGAAAVEQLRRETAELPRWGPSLSDAHRREIVELQRHLEAYLVSLSGGHGSGVAGEDRSPRLATVLSAIQRLSTLESVALSRHLEDTRQSMGWVYRRWVISSWVLLSMGALLAYLVYRGLIAPLRERLRQSRKIIERQEKLGSLGVLAAGVAHEIRNPLTSIKARLYTQQAVLPPESEAFEDNVFITEEISRLEQIVRDFLAFARPSEPQLVRVRSTRPLRDVEALMRPTLERGGLRLETEFLADPWVKADPHQLKQVLLNLVRNAAEALGAEGTIRLRTRTEKRVHLRPAIHVAVIEVEDDGPGIPPEVQRRLFDPFFTTKPSGTGLGLSIAARIIEAHGGTLEYRPAERRGTLFRVLLPIDHPHDVPENPAD